MALRVLMFPWLAHAHIFPFLELAKNLSKKNFHIHFCSTSINLDSVKQSLNTSDDDHYSSIDFVDLHLPSLSELPPEYHTTRNIPPHLLSLLVKTFQKSSNSFSDIIKDLKPDLLIYDGFQPWAAKIASSQGIPSVLFSVSGATSLSFFHHMHTYSSTDTFPSQTVRIREYEVRNLMSQGEAIQIEDAGEGFLFGIFNLSHDVVLIKSCRGFEGKYIDHLSSLCKKKIIPTGPLVSFSDSHDQDSDILKWLRDKKVHSTVYISFGSENYFTKDQIREIARGLEMVGDVNFIWVIRSPAGGEITVEKAAPERFLDGVRERGMIVKGWAPQDAILAHPSVGGYMSHCGWSSVTESMYFGVPVVAVPLQSDHPLNARLVGESGVGVEVERDENGGFDGEGVAKAIKEVFVGGEMRRRCRVLSEEMMMEEEEDMDGVVEELSRICLRK